MLQFNEFLKAKLVKEIQVTKIGFAICPASVDAQGKLDARKGEIEASLSPEGQCKFEKPAKFVAYRLSGASSTYSISGGRTDELKKITATVVAETLASLTNVAPINILESKGFGNSECSAKKN